LSEDQPSKYGKKLDAMSKELVAIKKLLILIASKSGATSDEIGKVLDVSGSAIRNVLAEKKKLKTSSRRKDQEFQNH